MLKPIQQRRLDKFVRRLNGHWYTIMTRKSNSGRLPHANTVSHKAGKIFHDYAGQNTSLNSFKTPQQLDQIARNIIAPIEKPIKPPTPPAKKEPDLNKLLWQRVLSRISGNDYRRKFSTTMETRGGGLWDYWQIRLHKRGWSLTFFTDEITGKRMLTVYLAREEYPRTIILK